MTDKSPNLEVVSDRSTGALASTHERRRRPRLNLTTEQFRMSPSGKVFSVADLSTGGMALRVIHREDFLGVPVATLIEGILNIRGEKFPARARIRHLGKNVIGCQFEDLPQATREALERLLDPASLGRELRPIPSSDSGTLWYHGPSGTDLLLTRGADGQYRRIMLFVLGSFIQWDHEQGTSTGRAGSEYEHGVGQRSEEWGIVQFETILLQADPEPDLDKLSIAKALILSSNLPQDLKKWCVRKLEMA